MTLPRNSRIGSFTKLTEATKPAKTIEGLIVVYLERTELEIICYCQKRKFTRDQHSIKW